MVVVTAMVLYNLYASSLPEEAYLHKLIGMCRDIVKKIVDNGTHYVVYRVNVIRLHQFSRHGVLTTLNYIAILHADLSLVNLEYIVTLLVWLLM